MKHLHRNYILACKLLNIFYINSSVKYSYITDDDYTAIIVSVEIYYC